MNHRSEVADEQKSLLLLSRLSHKDGNVLRRVVALDPLEAVGMVVQLA